MSGSHQEDLDLLLSLQDRIFLCTGLSLFVGLIGYLSDDGSPRRKGQADLSVFRDAVQDCLDYEPKPVVKAGKKLNVLKNSTEANVEKYSGLRIRNQSVTALELSERFSEIRFVRLPTIKNLLMGDTLRGCWATVGGTGFSLSVFSANQILKMGTSIDYGVCKGKRKDGLPCTLTSRDVLQELENSLQGSSQVTRHLLGRPSSRQNIIKKAHTASEIIVCGGTQKSIEEKLSSKNSDKASATQNRQVNSSEKRKSSTKKLDPSTVTKNQPDLKRTKTVQGQASVDKTKNHESCISPHRGAPFLLHGENYISHNNLDFMLESHGYFEILCWRRNLGGPASGLQKSNLII
ncbi:hypothetical protein NC651_023319 [Populus alba x Populus x berolinensis]|nr:hypothetical protein NC651_023319 [Populus alba x Populus x berolinensis]